jgi:hypothetical protein
MADAIIALTANLAMRGRAQSNHKPERIEFKESWFDAGSKDVPDGEMIVESV